MSFSANHIALRAEVWRQMQLDEETTFEGGSRPLEEPEAMRTTDDQEDPVGCHDETEVVEMAMVALSLLRRDDKTMLQQVKHLVKANHQLAQKVFTTEVDGWTPVHACALRGKKKVLKAMLQAGIDVNLKMGQPDGLPGQCNLLHIAANRPDKKIIDYLIHHGADVNARDSFGRTPIFYAHRAGNKDCVRTLADSGGHLSDMAEESEIPCVTESEETTTPEPRTTRFCFLAITICMCVCMSVCVSRSSTNDSRKMSLTAP
ncbi:hypothetical protein C0Q70_07542 [Pomacea canaliculata]|uniref:Uncharacterized protein n=1 Tax=Pomacea canaliculata TaxID=400727 RepID=A0A2T7PFE1_POMCA|nr:hypothetical protein C0Q70_07542 [Pomacea canaliculata]